MTSDAAEASGAGEEHTDALSTGLSEHHAHRNRVTGSSMYRTVLSYQENFPLLCPGDLKTRSPDTQPLLPRGSRGPWEAGLLGEAAAQVRSGAGNR